MQYYLISFHGQKDVAHSSQMTAVSSNYILPRQASRRGKTPRQAVSADMHVYLGHSFTEGAGLGLEGNKGGFGGINSSTVTKSYSLLGILREKEMLGLRL